MRISCAVKNITNAGILAHTDEGEYSPLNIFIARDHHYNVAYFSELKDGDIIMVRVIGQRFELNDPFVSVIGELELKQERESVPSVIREIENAKKKGNPLSVVLEENSDMLGEFQISNQADAAAAAVASDEEPEELEEPEEPEEPEELEELEEPEEPEKESSQVEVKGEGEVEGEVEGEGKK
jgi:hypothetical protein